MIPENYMTIIDRIVEKSKAGRANWRETSDSDQLLLTFSDYSVTLSRTTPSLFSIRPSASPSTRVIEFCLLSKKGKTVDSFELNELDEHWERMDNLFQMARRKAAGIDNILKKLEKDLETSGEIGHKKPEAPPMGPE